MRLAEKTAVIVGAGQTPGQTMGNGRAVALRFAQEGARLLLVDKNSEWLEPTVAMVREAGGQAYTCEADITQEGDCARIAAEAQRQLGRIDILYNNVGRSEGDAETAALAVDMWDTLMNLNLRGMFLTCKHVLPLMRAQGSGVILNVSSTSSMVATDAVAYKTSKGAVNTLTHHLATENAPYGIRANAILPGLMDTPMAIERRAREQGVDRDVVRRARDARVPLYGQMGTAWDVAHAAVFLASDEARYITGALLPVDGGLLTKIG
jgi:NAD(P)-dependent dehydrogenase (short-subunit alcohol dehydrogenase family)